MPTPNPRLVSPSPQGDLSKVLTYHAWAGNVQNLTGPEGPLWTGENCPNTPEGIHYRQRANMINGTEAFTFHPFVTTSSRLQVYTEDLKRSADLVFANHTSVRGISTLAFKIADSQFAGGGSLFFFLCGREPLRYRVRPTHRTPTPIKQS